MVRRLLPLLLAAAVLSAAAGPASATAGPCGSGERTGRFTLVLRSGGITRYALVNVPPGVSAARRLPLVLALHGAGGTGREMDRGTGLSGLADRAGFVAVYPSAAWKLWNIAASPGKPDDIAFIQTVLDTVESQVCIAPDRVYATGGSN